MGVVTTTPTDTWIKVMAGSGEGAGNNLKELNQLMSTTSALNQQILRAVEKLQRGEGKRGLSQQMFKGGVGIHTLK